MTDRPPKLHRAVKPLALVEPRLSSAEIYDLLKADWTNVNQQWLRRNIVSYAAAIRKNHAKQNTIPINHPA